MKKLVILFSILAFDGLLCDRAAYSQSETANSRKEVQSTFADRQTKRHLLFTDSLMKKHDSNEDGILQPSERENLRKSLQGADANGDGMITRQELAEELRRAMAPKNSTLAFQMTGKLPDGKSDLGKENPTLHFKLLQIDKSQRFKELSSLVQKFAAAPDNPSKLADEIMNFDTAVLLHSSLMKPPIGKYFELHT